MIVSEDTVHKALQYLAEDPHPLALAKKDLRDAENRRDEIYAELFLRAEGAVATKDAIVKSDRVYADAMNQVAQAEMEEQRHKSRIHAADMLIEVWRSEQANARTAEKVR